FGADRARSDFQVVSPQKDGILGCHNLNKEIAILFGGSELQNHRHDNEENPSVFRISDKVIRDQNGSVDMLILRDWASVDDLIDVFGSVNALTIVEMIEAGDERLGHRYYDGRHYAVVECNVVNGDLGEIVGFDGRNASAKTFVKFFNPDRFCMLPS